ncbi:MAG: thioredoxin domain-containing protein [Candidatus Sericytochromatia bacterium]|nr:thioredoxin domain-containing protein [Candidatus Tanganyikabacteria bacterium]
MKQKTAFILAAVGLLLAFIVGAIMYRAQETDTSAALAEKNRTVLLRDHSPVLGRTDAPVTIVEFIDPACETCRHFYPLVKDMLAAHPDELRLVMRYAPFHQGADAVVAVLEATRKQGKYWQAMEALLFNQSAWAIHHVAQVDLAWKPLEGLGLDLAKVRADAKDPAIARLIAQDLADARTLGVTKTPEYFVNGRPLPTFGYEPLKQLVDEEIRRVRRK